ncbi:hypothetical protein ACUIAJ_03920 [Dermabacteraceae bacterium CCM 9519]
MNAAEVVTELREQLTAVLEADTALTITADSREWAGAIRAGQPTIYVSPFPTCQAITPGAVRKTWEVMAACNQSLPEIEAAQQCSQLLQALYEATGCEYAEPRGYELDDRRAVVVYEIKFTTESNSF